MRTDRFEMALDLVEKYAAKDEGVSRCRTRILDHLPDISRELSDLYTETVRFFFTLYPQRYGLEIENPTPEQLNDPGRSIAEVIIANKDQITDEKWFGDAEPQLWVALIALHYLDDSLMTRRVIENLISRGDISDLEELENANVTVADHMNTRCHETAEILTVADCFAQQKESRQTKAKKGAQKRHERSYKAIRGFIEYYEHNGSLSRSEAARRYYRESLADLQPPLYRNEEQAVRALTAGLRKNIGLKN